MLIEPASQAYQLKGNRVARASSMDIKLRARRFCSLLRVNKRTRYDISTFLESLSDHQICIDPIADKEWLWLTDACCDPLTLTILVPQSTYIKACYGDKSALAVIMHEIGHITLAHRAVLHNERSAPPCKQEDAEWQADEFAAYVMHVMGLDAYEQLSLDF
jgi:hypothetical protein